MVTLLFGYFQDGLRDMLKNQGVTIPYEFISGRSSEPVLGV
jgi:hypothetical protein